jgi:hypothetical protein
MHTEGLTCDSYDSVISLYQRHFFISFRRRRILTSISFYSKAEKPPVLHILPRTTLVKSVTLLIHRSENKERATLCSEDLGSWSFCQDMVPQQSSAGPSTPRTQASTNGGDNHVNGINGVNGGNFENGSELLNGTSPHAVEGVIQHDVRSPRSLPPMPPTPTPARATLGARAPAAVPPRVDTPIPLRASPGSNTSAQTQMPSRATLDGNDIDNFPLPPNTGHLRDPPSIRYNSFVYVTDDGFELPPLVARMKRETGCLRIGAVLFPFTRDGPIWEGPDPTGLTPLYVPSPTRNNQPAIYGQRETGSRRSTLLFNGYPPGLGPAPFDGQLPADEATSSNASSSQQPLAGPVDGPGEADGGETSRAASGTQSSARALQKGRSTRGRGHSSRSRGGRKSTHASAALLRQESQEPSAPPPTGLPDAQPAAEQLGDNWPSAEFQKTISFQEFIADIVSTTFENTISRLEAENEADEARAGPSTSS